MVNETEQLGSKSVSDYAILDPKDKRLLFFFFFYIYSLYAVSIQCIYWTPLEQYFSNFSMNQIHLAQGRGMLVKMQIHRLHHWREGSMLGPGIAF